LGFLFKPRPEKIELIRTGRTILAFSLLLFDSLGFYEQLYVSLKQKAKLLISLILKNKRERKFLNEIGYYWKK